MNRAQLLNRLDRAWETLKASYAGLTDSELIAPEVSGTWSIKPRYSVTYGGVDAFNLQTTEQKSNLSLQEVLQQRDDTHRRLIEFIQSVSEDQFNRETRFRRRLRLDTYSHYNKHVETIWKWRESRAAD